MKNVWIQRHELNCQLTGILVVWLSDSVPRHILNARPSVSIFHAQLFLLPCVPAFGSRTQKGMKHGVVCRSALLVISFACILHNVNSLSRNPKVLLISFDGFRYDLLNETMVPNIHRWAKQSTWFVNGSRSQYITYTAPNHMGIVTGLYEESHGIVSNYFFDTAKNKSWDYFNGTHTPGIVNESLREEWFRGEPIWITNERGGGSRLSATYFWPMGEAPFPTRPQRPHFHKQWTSYGNLTSWMADADDIIADFLREKDPVNFVAWYVAEPDHTLHANGFYNGVLKKTLKSLDQLFEYVLGKMADNQLEDKINIILTADHGHAEINGAKNIMCIKDFLPEGNFTIGDHMIYPNDEKHAQDIFRSLKNAIKMHRFDVDVHLKENFPARYHYTNSTRVGRIILEPKVGSAISFTCTAKQLERDYGSNSSVKFNSSTHGMDPDRPEMRAMLVMRGPDIVEKQTVMEIPQNIDLYPLICRLLDVTPAANNGTLNVLKVALKPVAVIKDRNIPQNPLVDYMGFLIFFAPPFLVVVLYFVYGCRHTILKDDPSWAVKTNGYRPLNVAEEEGSIQRGEDISMSSLLHAGSDSAESL